MSKKALEFLSLLDRTGNLSLTHLALYVCLVKLLLSPGDIASTGAFFISVLAHCHKRHVSAKAAKDATQDAVVQLENKVAGNLESVTKAVQDLGNRIQSAELSVGVVRTRLGLNKPPITSVSK